MRGQHQRMQSEVGQSSCYRCTGASEMNSTSCDGCPPGRYGPGPGQCADCQAGFYEWGRFTSCLSCLAGEYTEETKATKCKLCPRGKYSGEMNAIDNTTCAECSPGKYSDADGAQGVFTCKPCPAGRWSDEHAALPKQGATCARQEDTGERGTDKHLDVPRMRCRPSWQQSRVFPPLPTAYLVT